MYLVDTSVLIDFLKGKQTTQARCRKSGITIRSTIDTLIATTAMENGLILLCSDKDFDNMAKVVDLNLE